MRSLRLLTATGAATAIGATSVALAVAASGGPVPDPVSAPSSPRTPVTAVQPQQSARFGALRRGRRAGDVLTPAAMRAVLLGPTTDLGANPDLARRVLGGADGASLVPADGWLCLVSDAGAVSCNRTEEAANGFLLGVEAREGGGTRVRAAVPDGASAVELVGDGWTVTARGGENAADFPAAPDGVRALRWRGPDGVREIPLGAPPG